MSREDERILFHTCFANSLVGDITTALKPDRLGAYQSEISNPHRHTQHNTLPSDE